MNRETLQAVLRAAGGRPEKSGTFRAGSEQRLTFYLGDARALVVSHVEEVRLEESFVVLQAKELGQMFVAYEAVCAVSSQPPSDSAVKKAGFA